MRITRRGILLGILAASSATLAYRRLPWKLVFMTPVEGFLLELLSVVAVPDPVLVGEARLRAVQHLGDDPQQLLDSVMSDLLAAGGSAREAANALRKKSRDQFKTGDVVSAGGWILARVEADLCALIALDRFPVRRGEAAGSQPGGR